MLTYSYVAYDPRTGRKVRAELEAVNQSSAAKLLTDNGLAPLEIEVKSDKSAFSHFANRIPTKQKIIFTRQLATLINAGLPLVQSLQNLHTQMTNKNLQAVIAKVIQDVEAGSKFSDALSRHPAIFNNVFTSLVAAGEASGTLDAALERLAVQQEKDAEVLSKIRGALIYPSIVIAVLIAVVVFMMTTILPQVQSLYNSFPGLTLPLVTRVLLAVSQFIIHYWWLVILLLIGAIYGSVRWSRTASGKSFFDALKLKLPAIKNLYTKVYMARFSRTGATLIASGVPMMNMLDITAQAVDNVHISASLEKAREQVKGGKALSVALKDDPNILPLVPNMISTGEQSGALDKIFDKIATYYEQEVDNEVKAISTIIEPILMIIIGIMALFIVAAILLPIYSLAGKNAFHT